MKTNSISDLLTVRHQGLIISIASPAASSIFFLTNSNGDRSTIFLLFIPFLILFAVTGVIFGLCLFFKTENPSPAVATQSGGAK